MSLPNNCMNKYWQKIYMNLCNVMLDEDEINAMLIYLFKANKLMQKITFNQCQCHVNFNKSFDLICDS